MTPPKSYIESCAQPRLLDLLATFERTSNSPSNLSIYLLVARPLSILWTFRVYCLDLYQKFPEIKDRNPDNSQLRMRSRARRIGGRRVPLTVLRGYQKRGFDVEPQEARPLRSS